MSKGKRKRYAAEFKAKVALEAMKGEEALIVPSWGSMNGNNNWTFASLSIFNLAY